MCSDNGTQHLCNLKKKDPHVTTMWAVIYNFRRKIESMKDSRKSKQQPVSSLPSCSTEGLYPENALKRTVPEKSNGPASHTRHTSYLVWH